MRITSITIKDMWSFDKEGVTLNDLGQLLILIGQNNSGKSNILKGVTWFKTQAGWLEQERKSFPNNIGEAHEYRGDENAEAEPFLSIGLSFSQSESERIVKSLPARGDINAKVVRSILSYGVDFVVDAAKPRKPGESLNWIVFNTGEPNLRNRVDPEVEKAVQNLSSGRARADTMIALQRIISSIVAEKITYVSSWRRIGEKTEYGETIVSHLGKWQAPTQGNKDHRTRFNAVEESFNLVTNLREPKLMPAHDSSAINISQDGLYLDIRAFGDGTQDQLKMAFELANRSGHVFLIEEPELRLHPEAQQRLLDVLRTNTDNQFLVATHSPLFIQPDTIEATTRVFLDGRATRVTSISSKTLSKEKDRLHLISARSNEIVFFCDFVVLVEGLGDRLFWSKLLTTSVGCAEEDKTGSTHSNTRVLDVLGKRNFSKYVALFDGLKIGHCIVADLDYVLDLGEAGLAPLFETNKEKIREQLTSGRKSMDASRFYEIVESAIEKKEVTGLREIWSYMQSRFRKLKDKMSDEEKSRLQDFIMAQRQEGVFILRHGELEDYVPKASRSLEGIIQLVSQDDLWAVLGEKPKHRRDLEEIRQGILKMAGKQRASQA